MVKDQGYDLDSLIYMCKDIRELFKELNLEKQEIFEVLENLKKAYDYSNGKTDPYNEDLPLKVTVTNACTKVIFYFTLNNSSKICILATFVSKYCPKTIWSLTFTITKTVVKKYFIYIKVKILV
jgi:hypothetical protein